MKIIKNNITRNIGEVSPDKMQIGAIIKLNSDIYSHCLHEKREAVKKNKKAFFNIGDEEWIIKSVDTMYHEVVLENSGVETTLRFTPHKYNPINIYMYIRGKVFWHNEGGDIFRCFVQCLCDEHECEIIEGEPYLILGADIKRDLDIPIKAFANMFKKKKFKTTLRKQGHIYENFDLYHFEQKVDPLVNSSEYETDTANKESTIATDYDESHFSFHVGAPGGIITRIYDKDHENTVNSGEEMYGGNYTKLTRFECSLAHNPIKSFYRDGKQLITLEDFENNIISIFKTIFGKTIRVPQKSYSTRNVSDNDRNWKKIVAGLPNDPLLKRKTSKLQNNPHYNREQYNKADITRTANIISKNMKLAKNDGERMNFLRKVLGEGMTEQYFDKFIVNRNREYGDVSLDSKRAYDQIQDSQREAGEIITHKTSPDSVTVDLHSTPVLTSGALNCGAEYIKVISGDVYSRLTYMTAKRCNLLTDRCLQDIENGVIDMKEYVDFYDLHYPYRKIIMS